MYPHRHSDDRDVHAHNEDVKNVTSHISGPARGIARFALLYHACVQPCTGLVQVGVDVGLVNDEGLRGTTAARDFQQGEVVVRVPRNCTLALGPHAWTPAVRCPPLACAPLTWHGVQCWRADAVSLHGHTHAQVACKCMAAAAPCCSEHCRQPRELPVGACGPPATSSLLHHTLRGWCAAGADHAAAEDALRAARAVGSL